MVRDFAKILRKWLKNWLKNIEMIKTIFRQIY